MPQNLLSVHSIPFLLGKTKSLAEVSVFQEVKISSIILTSPAGNIFQPVVNFFLQDWKSLAVYEASASPIVSEKSLTK